MIEELQRPSSLCAQQQGALQPGAVQYYPCVQGGILLRDRSKLFLIGQLVQLRMIKTVENCGGNYIHLYEVEVHGY